MSRLQDWIQEIIEYDAAVANATQGDRVNIHDLTIMHTRINFEAKARALLSIAEAAYQFAHYPDDENLDNLETALEELEEKEQS